MKKDKPNISRRVLGGMLFAFWMLAVSMPPAPAAVQDEKPAADESTEEYRGELGVLMARVREELVTLPNYDVFDWIEARVFEDGHVILEGSVVEPTTRDYATGRVENLDDVHEITNDIEVLPLSAGDHQIRVAVYGAIYGPGAPLFRYAGRTLPPVHIIVNRGHVTLEGIVGSEVDRQVIASEARSVPGVFDVENKVQIEHSA